MYGWKRMSDGGIVQGYTADTPDKLFEAAGFGAVDMDKPVKGYLAVKVERRDGVLFEIQSN